MAYVKKTEAEKLAAREMKANLKAAEKLALDLAQKEEEKMSVSVEENGTKGKRHAPKFSMIPDSVSVDEIGTKERKRKENPMEPLAIRSYNDKVTLGITVPDAEAAKAAENLLRRAANDNEYGMSIVTGPDYDKKTGKETGYIRVKFTARDRRPYKARS